MLLLAGDGQAQSVFAQETCKSESVYSERDEHTVAGLNGQGPADSLHCSGGVQCTSNPKQGALSGMHLFRERLCCARSISLKRFLTWMHRSFFVRARTVATDHFCVWNLWEIRKEQSHHHGCRGVHCASNSECCAS